MADHTSFSDSLAVVAAELVELSKRPVSTNTYQQLQDLKERLETVLEDFVHCPSCDGMFPENSVARLTLKGRTATICSICAITALQRGELELKYSQEGPPELDVAGDRAARGVEKKSPPRKRKAAKPEPVADPVEDEEPEEDSAAETEPDEDDEAGEEAVSEPVVDRRTTTLGGRRGSGSGRTARLSEEADGESDEEPEASRTRRPKKLTAKPPASSEEFKATFADVAQYTDRTSREVRQIGKLIEEISPPMNVEKTTRYVQAELKNTRSRIPVDVVGEVVRYLKEGLPSHD